MIAGVTPALNVTRNGYPTDLALRAWSDVCDQIIVVASTSDPDVEILRQLANDKIKVRGIIQPTDVEVFRFLGGLYAQPCPDFIVYFDLDYLISPTNALHLRKFLLTLKDDVDIVTYVLNYLNYSASHTVYIPQMKQWNPPFNGYQATHPLIVNPRRQNFMAPFTGLLEGDEKVDAGRGWRGYMTTAESVICFRPDKWGKPFDMKNLNDNPHEFNIVHSEIEVEHLSFSLNNDVLEKKLSHPYWVNQAVDVEYVRKGYQPFEVSYPILEEARQRYS